jgi:hypothetical protein
VVNKEVQMIDCLPDCSLRESAIVELNKMEGVYAKAALPVREKVHIIKPGMTHEEADAVRIAAGLPTKHARLPEENIALEQHSWPALDEPEAAI